jgi:phage terminase large subunit
MESRPSSGIRARKCYYIGYRDPLTGKPTQPLDTQAAFHQSLAPNRAYIGGMGSGKTATGAVETLALAMKYPNNFILVGRVSLPELEHTTKKTFLEEIIDPELLKDSRFFKGKNLLVLPNGSQVLFTHLLNPMRFRSMQLGAYWLDEAIEAGCEDADNELKKRLRLPHVGRRCAYYTSNPGLETSYLFEQFCNTSWVTRRRYEVFTASSLENPYLPNDYLERLHDMSDDEYQVYVLGKWMQARGRIFDTFDRNVHVIQPFPIPAEWHRFRSMDFGIAHMMVCGWWAVDELENRLIQYREWPATGVALPDFVETVRSLDEGESIAYTVVDPSSKARSIQTGITTFDQLATMGMAPVLGDNDVLSSIRRTNGLLRYSATMSGDFIRKPGLLFFNTCQDTVQQMERYQWEVVRGKPTGRPLKKNDDCVDMVRYAVQNALQVTPTMYIDPEKQREETSQVKHIRQMCAENERRRMGDSGMAPLMSKAAPRLRRMGRASRLRRVA